MLTAQFRTSSGGQYSVGRAFNERLKKLVDKSDDVRFAQTYPQTVISPNSAQVQQLSVDRDAQPASGKGNVVNVDGSESPPIQPK